MSRLKYKMHNKIKKCDKDEFIRAETKVEV